MSTKIFKKAVTLITLFSFFSSSTLYAQDLPKREKPVWTINVETDKAEMSFEETRALVLLYADYIFLYQSYHLQKDWIANTKEANKQKDISLGLMRSALDGCTKTNEKRVKELHTMIAERDEARRYSVFDGALPYVATALVIAFGGGLLVGVRNRN